MKILNTKILLIAGTLLAAASIAVAATFAFLSDTETSSANEFEAGVLDLLIDNTSYYNGELNEGTTWTIPNDLEGRLFFDFRDLKPGDWGEDTISIHVNNNNAYGCFESALTSDDDVSSNEPELEDGDEEENPADNLDGELGENIDFIFWVDDGDNVLEDDENVEGSIIAQGTANEVLSTLSGVLADSIDNLFGLENGDPLVGGQTYYIAKAWCFGTMTLEPVVQDGNGPIGVPGEEGSNGPDFRGSGFECNGSGLDNSTQTDTLTADIQFSAVQHRNNTQFTCDRPTPTITPTPTSGEVFSCEEVENPIFASSVVENTQGLRKNGTSVLATRQNPSTALVPQTTGVAFDPAVTEGTFYALGFPHLINNGSVNGEITVDMGTVFYNNVGGNDIRVWEVTGGTSYPVETVLVYAKLNLVDGWTLLGNVNRDGEVDMAPLESARYIRLVEASAIGPFEATADGYDLDGVQALCTQGNLVPLDPGGQ